MNGIAWWRTRRNGRPRSPWVAAVAAALVAAAGAGGAACRPMALAPSMTVMWGDSITWQSADYLRFFFRVDAGADLEVHAAGGTALCDWVPQIIDRLDTAPPPARVVLSFWGNNLTACMGGDLTSNTPGHRVGSATFLQVWAAGMDAVTDAASRHGVPVVWVTPPPRSAADADPGLNETFNAMARRRGWRVVTDGERRLGTSTGGFALTQDCEAWETAADGCVDGRITVRDHDGTHFDPRRANGYGAGSLRWSAAAMAEVAAG